ncbi:recombinase family protein [Rothia sp. P4278]|uniref:recombinase family protein n=1 Tax=Rothia sp. P4278 TaxID=3402658 RepID=UPI003AEAD27E
MKLGYIRVSTPGQVESVRSQQQQLQQYGCEKIFTDIASGAQTARPAFREILSYARKKDSIVVTRLDRLGRSTVDTLKTVQELDQRGITIRALDTSLDTSTPQGRLVLSVLASLAQWERELLVERTKDGLAHARAQGRVGGRKPALDPEQQQAALSSLASGMSENQVAKAFGVSRATISRLKAKNKAMGSSQTIDY